MKANCPTCGSLIPLADINVATDIALCRSCNQAFSFSELVEDTDAPTIDLSRPPSGVWFQEDFQGFTLGSTTRSPMALFIVPFMCVWSGFSLYGIYGKQIDSGEFKILPSLFGIPFVIGTIVLGSFALMTVLGKIVVSVRGDEGEIFTGVGMFGWRKGFKWNEVGRIKEDNSSYGGRGQPSKVIVLEGSSRTSFGTMLNEKRRYFIIEALKRMLRKRKPLR